MMEEQRGETDKGVNFLHITHHARAVWSVEVKVKSVSISVRVSVRIC